jgi:hypothetical protein
VCLLVRTCQSHISVAQAARTRAFVDGKLLDVRRRVIEEPGYIGQELKIELKQGETLVLEKLASFYTSRDHAISECALEARKAIARAGRFDAVLAEHVLAWKHLWRRFDVHIQPSDPGFKTNVPMLLRTCCKPARPTPSAWISACPRAAGQGKRIRATYSGTNCSSFRFSIIECPKSLDRC